MDLLEKNIIVGVRHGVHGRIATRLARIALEEDVTLHIVRQEGDVDCSSVLDVLSMAFVYGTCLRFRAAGKGAVQALAAVEKLFAAKEES